MSKAVKKIQTEIECNGAVQTKIDYSKEEREFLEEIENSPEVAIIIKTVEEMYDMVKEGKIYRNTEYNRKYSWGPAIYGSYEYSLVKKSVVPPIIVRKVKWKKTFKYEVIDGGHRVETIPKIIDNQIRLPDSVLLRLGGGGYYKEADPKVKKAIRQAKLILFDLGYISDEEVSRIFCSLQNGQKLKPGQKIKGMQYGIHAQCINKGLTSKLWENLSNNLIINCLHYSIIVQTMRFEESLQKQGKIPHKKEYLRYVETNDLPTNTVLINKVVHLLDKLSDVLRGTRSSIRLQSLIRGEVWFLFIREHASEPVHVLSEFFDRFYENLSYVNNVPEEQRDKKMDMYHNYNRLKYEDIYPFLEFFNKKFDSFKKGEMESYEGTIQTKLTKGE